MKIVDTNLLLRYFLRDDPQKADSVERLFKRERKKLFIPDLIIAEVVWVLSSVYKQKREQIALTVEGLLSLKDIKISHELISKTLENYRHTNLKWVDSYIAALVQIGDAEGVYSYDRDFNKIPGTRRLEPK